MLGGVPQWLLPWLAMLSFVMAVVLAAVLPSALDGVALVLVVWGIPMGIVGYRHWTGRDAADDGMPTGRLDSLLRRK